MSTDYLLHLAAESGGVLYVMAALLLVALTVIIERSWYLNRLVRQGEIAAAELGRLTHFDRVSIERLVKRMAGAPHAEVLAVPLAYPDLDDPALLGPLLEEAVMAQAPRIDRSMWILDTIVTLAPLLGLLGTIVGMFNSFQVLGRPGSAPTEITGGIAEALVATACGLFIAILGLVFFNGLNNSVRLVVHQLDSLKLVLVNRIALPRRAAARAQERPAPQPMTAPALANAVEG